jgi:pyruvate ferredoxin oxidoreductase beta subunit
LRQALGARYAIDAAMRAANNNLIAVARPAASKFSTPTPRLPGRSMDPLALRQCGCGRVRVAAAMRRKEHRKVRVVAQGGDGGTTDIGFGCRDVRAERRRAHLYAEARDTGAASGDAGALHRDDGGGRPRARQRLRDRQDLPLIAMAHGIPMSRPQVWPTCAIERKSPRR